MINTKNTITNYDIHRMFRNRQSGPRPETRLLRQPALEGLTRSARTDSPRRIGRKQFSGEEGGGGGGLREERGGGIQLAVGPQPLWLRNHNSGPAQRIMVKHLATSPHDPIGITDSACKNQLVVVSVQYGPFNPYIPIRSTTIGKSRVAIDPIAMHTSWRSNSDIASVTSITAFIMSSIKNPLATILDSNKFTGLNYQDWLQNLNIVLASEKLLYTIEKSPPKEAPADISPEELVTLQQWWDDELKTRCYVMASMSKEMQRRFEKTKYAADYSFISKNCMGKTLDMREYNTQSIFLWNFGLQCPTSPLLPPRKVPLEDLIYTSCTDPIPQPAAARTPRLYQPSAVLSELV
ncbi:hypothetical protein F511_37121 [Dorcoceras hygrometricum]|uniref:Uncharacterized protein n=1 Tax=Dorcoceras hygrometricum TaxID=472368 RepID=A0A2Z7D0B3_9LAMI|nr:hypothetical protein F511_37121 [Dorcoceras hygrometricum]